MASNTGASGNVAFLDASGELFPRIDVLVSMNQLECWDTVLNILASPIDMAVP